MDPLLTIYDQNYFIENLHPNPVTRTKRSSKFPNCANDSENLLFT